MRTSLRNLPTRIATGAYILHSGWEKWHGTEEDADRAYGMAVGAYPFLDRLKPNTFFKALAIAELGIGTALLTPLVPNRVAGALLTGFSGGLVGMYLRTPALHEPGSPWPTPAGMAVSKDFWMVGIGTGLLADPAHHRG